MMWLLRFPGVLLVVICIISSHFNVSFSFEQIQCNKQQTKPSSPVFVVMTLICIKMCSKSQCGQ